MKCLLDEVSQDKMSVDEMSVDEMSVGKMSVDEMLYCHQLNTNFCSGLFELGCEKC